MESPETYNRVSKIESSTLSNTLSIATFSAIFIAIILAVLTYTGSFSLWIGGSVCLTLLILAQILLRLNSSRSRYCRFCGGPLQHINREMILSSEYLAMQGVKKGNIYYAPNRWAKKHSATGWAKISHRAKACHHCRISQEGYQAHYQAAPADELKDIGINP